VFTHKDQYVAVCEAQMDGLERGEPLSGMTLAESVAHLVSLVVRQDWDTYEERSRARSLVLRLSALGWRD
jgi:hypothetical protein